MMLKVESTDSKNEIKMEFKTKDNDKEQIHKPTSKKNCQKLESLLEIQVLFERTSYMKNSIT